MEVWELQPQFEGHQEAAWDQMGEHRQELELVVSGAVRKELEQIVKEVALSEAWLEISGTIWAGFCFEGV